MQPHSANREEEIVSIFASASAQITPLISRAGLTPDEAEEFRTVLFVWFHAFTRRLGNERLPVVSFKATLLEAADRYIGEFHHGNGAVAPHSEPDDSEREH